MKARDKEDLLEKVGGIFKFSALMQKRLRELYRGDKPLVSGRFNDMLEIVSQEIMEGKVSLEPAAPAELAAQESSEEVDGEGESDAQAE